MTLGDVAKMSITELWKARTRAFDELCSAAAAHAEDLPDEVRIGARPEREQAFEGAACRFAAADQAFKSVSAALEAAGGSAT